MMNITKPPAKYIVVLTIPHAARTHPHQRVLSAFAPSVRTVNRKNREDHSIGNSSNIWPSRFNVPWNAKDPSPIMATPIDESIIFQPSLCTIACFRKYSPKSKIGTEDKDEKNSAT
tara:strand:- start:273 stop:620 length:348 start_codon:yes stop_codon:yes gene_type:complete